MILIMGGNLNIMLKIRSSEHKIMMTRKSNEQEKKISKLDDNHDASWEDSQSTMVGEKSIYENNTLKDCDHSGVEKLENDSRKMTANRSIKNNELDGLESQKNYHIPQKSYKSSKNVHSKSPKIQKPIRRRTVKRLNSDNEHKQKDSYYNGAIIGSFIGAAVTTVITKLINKG